MADNNTVMPDINEQIQNRIDKMKTLQAEGKDPFEITSYDVNAHANDIKGDFESFEGKEVSIAGRMMSRRVMGKASFANVADLSGNIQLYVARDDIGEEEYKAFKKFDIGDIVGVKGTVFKTKTGETSVHVTEITLLTKSLQVLPEKFHGLKDTDQRYRQRYVDLIVNPEVRETFVKRSAILKEIRDFLSGRDFIEVETPLLVENAGGAAARPFTTHYNALDQDIKLRISLELYLKRLIVGGMERVYEIGRVFRNEGVDTRHNPEFTLLELYQAFTDYNGMMELTESLIRDVCKKVNGTAVVPYGKKDEDGNGEVIELDFESPFRRITMMDAVKEYAGVDFNEIPDTETAKKIAKEKGVEFEDRHERGDILSLFFEEFCEEKLVQPTFVIDHPIEISPLTKKKPGSNGLTERFELFVAGRELANAYSELNDPIDQRERFEAQEKLKAAGDDEAQSLDEDFLNALAYGMPPTGGVGIGIDRLVMLLTNESSIRDVLLFPTLKSLN